MSEEFQTNCDQCNQEFRSNDPLWPNFETQHDENERLQLILDPGGFHPKWHCSEKCQLEDTEELRAAIKETYGESCGCGAKIGEADIRPCQECDKLVCETCKVTGKGGSHERFCSETCSDAKTNCKRCNMRIPTGSGDHCEYCKARN